MVGSDYQHDMNAEMTENSSFEIVKAAIEFENPPRIPIEDLIHPESSDIVGVGFEPAIWKWERIDEGTEACKDLFGCVRHRHDKGIGEIHKPAMEDWHQFDDFTLPDMQSLKEISKKQLHDLPEDKYVLGDLGQFLFKVFEIRGFENAMLDFAIYPEKMHELIEKLTDFAIERIRMYIELGGIHGISMYDDWGTQSSMLISPEQWREFFLENYQRVFQLAHEHHLHIYFHSCGAMGPIIPDLIDAGVDIFNFDQPRLHGIKELSDQYAGKVAFSCPVDIQATLFKGNKLLIEQEVKELVKYLHVKGGFIGKMFHSWEEDEGLDFDPGHYSRDIFESIKMGKIE